MLLLIILLQMSLINCNLNVAQINNIDNNIQNFNTNKYRRCINSKLGNFIQDSLKFFDTNQRYSEFNDYNVSRCSNYDDCGINSDNHVDKQIHGLLVQEDVAELWDEFKLVHNKIYSTLQQEMEALSKWRENIRRVVRHNQDYLAGRLSYSLHLNHFGDLGATDYFNKVLKLIDTRPLFDPAEDHHKTAFKKNLHRPVPRQVDWRARGFRPRREEQWQCGACYAFAVTHAVQAQLYRKHRVWKELSPQQIVDCSYKDGNMGCDGGSLRAAMRYAARDGLLMETHYPYMGKKGRCHYSALSPRVRPRRWATLPIGDEAAMEKALATIGPLAVAVNAAPFTFQLYRSGIYDDPFCTPWKLNHAMLLVGYTPQYWILLNWWGKNWGEDGYMRIRRGFNRCGVANMATYVEL